MTAMSSRDKVMPSVAAANAISSKEESNTAADTSVSAQSMSSLLAQALEVPSLDHPATSSSFEDATAEEEQESMSSSTTATPTLKSIMPSHLFGCSLSPPPPSSFDDYEFQSPGFVMPKHLEEMILLPQHSDFTIPTSNARFITHSDKAPPLEITRPPPAATVTATADNDDDSRRRIFGSGVGRRYGTAHPPPTARQKQQQQRGQPPRHTNYHSPPHPPPPPAETPSQVIFHTSTANNTTVPSVSPLTPAKTYPLHDGTIATNGNNGDDDNIPEELLVVTTPQRLFLRHHTTKRRNQFHETVHAQSFLLGLAFMAVWSPNNAMAPNLTQMAETFQMSEAQRDLYLGSYCALALGVFSLPISALLGFMADFYSRKHLFVWCVVGGSLASAWTGWSTSFVSLFWARLCSGGCMSASVPVAFSLLGDLFSTAERNAASSGLTAMMGLGILLGQVYAGTIGPTQGWQFPFFASAILSLTTALLVLIWVREPARGAKEKALQGLLQSGSKYERQLTIAGFMHAMTHNQSNSLLLWQGFFTSLPWGIVFCFLNDYLSQEKGFSVPDATFMVMLFGVGCAIGGILGGYIGQICQQHNRSLLPLFMAITTFAGTLPFLGLLNSEFPNKHGYKAMGYSILGGCIASLPSVNARPCILNVNPPETRGAALTASNLLITLGRGMGPSCITLMGSIFSLSRQASFNITLSVFWAISAVLLLFLVKTLPNDQDAMEEGLARYAAELAQQQAAAAAVINGYGSVTPRRDGQDDMDEDDYHPLPATPTRGLVLDMPPTPRSVSSDRNHLNNNDAESLVSIEDYMTSFDGNAARRSLQFMQQGIQEIKEEIACFHNGCGPCSASEVDVNEQDREDEEILEDILPQEELRKRQHLWKRQQQLMTAETQGKKDDDDDAGTNHEASPLLGVV